MAGPFFLGRDSVRQGDKPSCSLSRHRLCSAGRHTVTSAKQRTGSHRAFRPSPCRTSRVAQGESRTATLRLTAIRPSGLAFLESPKQRAPSTPPKRAEITLSRRWTPTYKGTSSTQAAARIALSGPENSTPPPPIRPCPAQFTQPLVTPLTSRFHCGRSATTPMELINPHPPTPTPLRHGMPPSL